MGLLLLLEKAGPSNPLSPLILRDLNPGQVFFSPKHLGSPGHRLPVDVMMAAGGKEQCPQVG